MATLATPEIVVKKLNVRGATLLELPENTDDRGSLCFCEAGKDEVIPFEIKRSFWVYDTPKGAVRGYHGHKESQQAHVCLHGSAKIWLDDGKSTQEIALNRPNQVLILGPMIWHYFSLKKGSLLFVFTSDHYDPKDYIRDYDEFTRLARL
jgi:dTDP-4-dehydrorhamnose 3,5-epimerase-like enzyme